MAGRIGFVDLNPDNFHANIFLAKFHSELKDRGYTVAGCTAIETEPARAWAQKHGVRSCETPAELNDHADFFMILAPNHPQTHFAFCDQFCPFGKPMWVDKTFAPDLPTAKRIFELADRYNVPMESSSALRYTAVQKHAREIGCENIRDMTAWGPGSSFDVYAIHPLEMVISCMGPAARRLMRRGSGDFAELLIDFDGGRTATAKLFCHTKTPYAATITTSKQTRYIPVATDTLFLNAAAAILDFFDARRPLIDREETLTIRQILDTAALPEAQHGFIDL